jgi:hypothetical protein
VTEENPGEETPQALDLTILELDQLLGIFISLLAAKAWQYMGIRLTPGKEEAEKDLVKAAAAIDLVIVMVDKVAPFLDEDDVGRLRSMIADLQLNYARQA